MTIRWAVEQFNDETVTVETEGGDLKVFPRYLFPEHLSEGDIFTVKVKAEKSYSQIVILEDKEEKESRLARSRKQVAHKSEWDKPGDIVL